MSDVKRSEFIELIRSNIERFGHHVYLIAGGRVPRYAYTIGLSKTFGFELLFCGGTYYTAKQVVEVLNWLVSELRADATSDTSTHIMEPLGSFAIRRASRSWSDKLMLGAFDYYGDSSIESRQVVPDAVHMTADVPDASTEWDPRKQPVWKALDGSWDLPFEPSATAMTNLSALRGARITEAARWQENQWELFAGAGPDVPRQDVRAVPLSTLVGLDPSLMPVVHVKVGAALWRNPNEDGWHHWGTAE